MSLYNILIDQFDESHIDLNLQKHQLFDSLHDFGKLSTCYDSLTYNRDSRKYSIEKMIFSFLTNYSFRFDRSLDIMTYYSNLKTSVGTITSDLQPKNLENEFLTKIRELQNLKAPGSFRTYKLEQILQNESHIQELQSLFTTSSNGKINLVVDTQKRLFDNFINYQDHNFTLVLPRESVYDPSAKCSPSQPALWAKKFDDIYYEINPDNREYRDIPGNFKINLKPINYNGVTSIVPFEIAEKEQVYRYNNEATLNTSSRHPNCISYLTKQINGHVRQLNKVGDIDFANTLLSKLQNRTIYKNFTNGQNFIKYMERIINPNLLNTIKMICISFTQKRLGDALQAEVCLLSKTNSYNFRSSKTRIELGLGNFVLVTIDRMLYAYSILIGCPAIYDHGMYREVFIPQSMQSSESIQTSSLPSGGMNRNQRARNNRLPRQNVIHTEDDQSNFVYMIENEPYCFFNFIPFIINSSLANANNKNTGIRNYDTYMTSSSLLSTIPTDVLNRIDNRRLIESNCLVNNELLYSGQNPKYYIFLQNGVNHLITQKTLGENETIFELTINGNTPFQHIIIEDVVTNFKIQLLSTNVGDYLQTYVKTTLEQISDDNNVNIDLFIDAFFDNLNPTVDVEENNILFGILKYSAISLFIIFVIIILYKLLNKKGGGSRKQKSEISFIEFEKRYFKWIKSLPIDSFHISKIYLDQLNEFYLTNYAWFFINYEMKLCVDAEQFAIDYDDCRVLQESYYIPTHKTPYYFFQYLIKDIQVAKKRDICYIFIDAILNELDPVLYDRLNDIKYYVMTDELDEIPEDYFNPLRSGIDIYGKLKKSNSAIYENTRSYLINILEKVHNKNREVESRMSELFHSSPERLFDYCIKNVELNRHSFLNMFTMDSLLKKTISRKTKSLPILKNLSSKKTKMRKARSLSLSKRSTPIKYAWGDISEKTPKNRKSNKINATKKISSVSFPRRTRPLPIRRTSRV